MPPRAALCGTASAGLSDPCKKARTTTDVIHTCWSINVLVVLGTSSHRTDRGVHTHKHTRTHITEDSWSRQRAIRVCRRPHSHSRTKQYVRTYAYIKNQPQFSASQIGRVYLPPRPRPRPPPSLPRAGADPVNSSRTSPATMGPTATSRPSHCAPRTPITLTFTFAHPCQYSWAHPHPATHIRPHTYARRERTSS